MTKQRRRTWLKKGSGKKGENTVHNSILKDRKDLSRRLTEEELGLLIDTFDATGSEDLYGSLREYLSVIQSHVFNTRSTIKDLNERLYKIRKLSKS